MPSARTRFWTGVIITAMIWLAALMLGGNASPEDHALRDTLYAGEGNGPTQAWLGAAIRLAYALQGGFDSLRLSGIDIDIDVSTAASHVARSTRW